MCSIQPEVTALYKDRRTDSSSSLELIDKIRQPDKEYLNETDINIDQIDPPQILLPSALFWDFIFPSLDQRDFGKLACTCRGWYQAWWDPQLWKKMSHVCFSDKGLRKSGSKWKAHYYWYQLLSKMGFVSSKLQARTVELVSHKRFSFVKAAKMTCPLGPSDRDLVPPCLHALLSTMPELESLYIGGNAGSVLFWSQRKVFSELVQYGRNLKELMIPSYPPRGIRALVRYHPNIMTLHLQNLVGHSVYGDWANAFKSRHGKNSRLKILTLIDQGPVTLSDLKAVLFCCPNLHTLYLRGNTFLKEIPRTWRTYLENLTRDDGPAWAKEVVIDKAAGEERDLYTFDATSGTVVPSLWKVDYTDYSANFLKSRKPSLPSNFSRCIL